jgi:hypothetical protein
MKDTGVDFDRRRGHDLQSAARKNAWTKGASLAYDLSIEI